MEVLITGGAGFIGNNLARRLIAGGNAVVAIDDLSLGRRENLPPEVMLVNGDVADADTWDRAPGVDAIVHLAGASSAPMFPNDLVGCFHNNIEGFLRTLEWARSRKVARVLYASTSSVYGNVEPPLREDAALDIPNFYAVSKYCMEQIARMYQLQYELDVVGFRFMSVYGPREDHKGNYANLISQFIWDVEAGRPPVVYGDGEQTRDFTNVGDICQALQLALEHPQPLGSTVFNVGTGEGTSVNQLIRVLEELTGRTVQSKHIPNPVKSGYVRTQLADITRIEQALGYRPTISLRQGVEEILALRASR